MDLITILKEIFYFPGNVTLPFLIIRINKIEKKYYYLIAYIFFGFLKQIYFRFYASEIYEFKISNSIGPIILYPLFYVFLCKLSSIKKKKYLFVALILSLIGFIDLFLNLNINGIPKYHFELLHLSIIFFLCIQRINFFKIGGKLSTSNKFLNSTLIIYIIFILYYIFLQLLMFFLFNNQSKIFFMKLYSIMFVIGVFFNISVLLLILTLPKREKYA
jgi:hypothetical protein